MKGRIQTLLLSAVVYGSAPQTLSFGQNDASLSEQARRRASWVIDRPNHHSECSENNGRSSLSSALSSSSASSPKLKFKNMDELLASYYNESLLVAFTSIHCGPCHLQKKELGGFLEHYQQGTSNQQQQPLRILSIDTDRWPHLGLRFNVGKLPCLMLLKHGEPLLRFDGLTRADELLERVRSFL